MTHMVWPYWYSLGDVLTYMFQVICPPIDTPLERCLTIWLTWWVLHWYSLGKLHTYMNHMVSSPLVFPLKSASIYASHGEYSIDTPLERCLTIWLTWWVLHWYSIGKVPTYMTHMVSTLLVLPLKGASLYASHGEYSIDTPSERYLTICLTWWVLHWYSLGKVPTYMTNMVCTPIILPRKGAYLYVYALYATSQMESASLHAPQVAFSFVIV